MTSQAPAYKLHPLLAGAVVSGSIFLALTALSTSASCALAQASAADSASAQAAGKLTAPGTQNKGAPAAPKNVSKPVWHDLTPAQQQSLKPLSATWDRLGEAQKRKWLVISKNYPSLPPSEQSKLHSRMTEWVSLSPQQRNQARLNFAETKKLSPAEKKATWQAYQALSPEEKQKLAAKAAPKPRGAAAVKPAVPPQKLAVVPVTRQASKQTPKIAAASQSVNHNTLLPQPAPSSEPAPPRTTELLQGTPN